MIQSLSYVGGGRRICTGFAAGCSGFKRLARESSPDCEPSSRGRLLAAPMMDMPPAVDAAAAEAAAAAAGAAAGEGFTGATLVGAPARPAGGPPRPRAPPLIGTEGAPGAPGVKVGLLGRAVALVGVVATFTGV